MTEIKLIRSGMRPLVFNGQLLAEVSTRKLNSTRWCVVAVYQSEKGKIVTSIWSTTQWEGEFDEWIVAFHDSLTTCMDYIEEHRANVAPALADKLNVVERLV